MKMNLTLWKNEYKKEDKHPDYILNKWDGENNEKVGAGWIKEAKNGKKFISISYNDEEEDREEESVKIEDVPF
jgi:uncharacterized protein (DUF736 family)